MSAVLETPTQTMILENISWETYERILAEHPDSPSPRFTFDNGYLELMILSIEHEDQNRTLSLVVEIVAAEMKIAVRRAGSNTFKREDLLKGFEPDSSFYIQNSAAVRGKKRLDLSIDPPPDLVIEVDVTSPSLPRLPIFAAVGVPEVWHVKNNAVKIMVLREDKKYKEASNSIALPSVTGEVLERFLSENETLESFEWVERVRVWAQS